MVILGCARLGSIGRRCTACFCEASELQDELERSLLFLGRLQLDLVQSLCPPSADAQELDVGKPVLGDTTSEQILLTEVARAREHQGQAQYHCEALCWARTDEGDLSMKRNAFLRVQEHSEAAILAIIRAVTVYHAMHACAFRSMSRSTSTLSTWHSVVPGFRSGCYGNLSGLRGSQHSLIRRALQFGKCLLQRCNFLQNLVRLQSHLCCSILLLLKGRHQSR